MNDDELEKALQGLAPASLPTGARERVFDAIERELRARPAFRSAVVFAAAVLVMCFSVLANIWIQRSSEKRLAQLMGPLLQPSAVAETRDVLVQTGGPDAARWLDYERQRPTSFAALRMAWRIRVRSAERLSLLVPSSGEQRREELQKDDPQSRHGVGAGRNSTVDRVRDYQLARIAAV